jgi:DNA-binding MarR family transcriptional regulator
MSKAEYPFTSLFGRTLKFLTDEFERRLQENKIELTIVEFILLYRLSTMQDDEITQQNFANMEGKHKSVILRQIDGLEQKHLVARMPDPTDGRKNILELTHTGMVLLEKVLLIENKMAKEMTQGLKATELETVKKAALTIQHNALKLIKK